MKNGVRERLLEDRVKYRHRFYSIDDPTDDVHFFATKELHIMFINHLELTDSGTYFCTAENTLGTDEQEFTVLGKG